MNSKAGGQTNRCEIVINISNISNSTVGVKHSIRRRTTLSPNLHSVEAETLEETTATIEKNPISTFQENSL